MKYPPAPLTPFLPALPGKSTSTRILSPKNSVRAPAIPLSTFRMNTSRTMSKQRTLSPFRMNTYAKTGGGGLPISPLPSRFVCLKISRLYASRRARAVTHVQLPLSPSSINMFRFFKELQIPPPANSFFSHLYKTLGVLPLPLATRLLPALSAFNFRLSTVDHYPCRAIVSPS